MDYVQLLIGGCEQVLATIATSASTVLAACSNVCFEDEVTWHCAGVFVACAERRWRAACPSQKLDLTKMSRFAPTDLNWAYMLIVPH
jgi:hypothetical protein